MRRIPPARALCAALLTSLALLAAGAARAGAARAPHGGGHLPPAPDLPTPPVSGPPGPHVPGDARRPPPTTPGGGRAGPATPGPSTGGPGPATPGGSGAPATPAPGGGFDPGDWSVWWELNQHAYLALREAVWRGPARTGEDEFFLGRGATADVPADLRPTDAQLAERVAPALKRVAAREGQPEVLSGCLTALAKLGHEHGDKGAPATHELLLGFLDHPNQQIRETAALSLGILGGPAVLRDLAALLADDARGRELGGGSKVDERTRAFAAYGLGVLAQRTDAIDLRRWVVHQLVQTLEKEARGSLDVAVACIHGLSLVELPSRPPEESAPPLPAAASREALLAYELALFEAAELPERALAHLPRALARALDPPADERTAAVLTTLAGVLARSKSHARSVVYGAIAGLGLVSRAAEAELERGVFEALEVIARDGDVMARQLALISLAQAASRPGVAVETTRAVEERLLVVLAKGKSRERPWAALALGIAGHAQRQQKRATSPDVSLALRQGLEECSSPSDAGAYAIGLGLRGAIGAADAVRAKLEEFREDRARGYMALALGLMRDRESTELLQELLPQAVYRPELIRPVAVALALLDDESLVPALVKEMEETDSSSVRAVYAWTLAQVGDARAIDPLVALLEDPEVPTLTRGIAALGLGITCERSILPWNTELARNTNYPAAPPSLFDPAGGGVLNIR